MLRVMAMAASEQRCGRIRATMRQNQVTDTHRGVPHSPSFTHTAKSHFFWSKKEKSETQLLFLKLKLLAISMKNFFTVCADHKHTHGYAVYIWQTHTRCVCSYTWTSALRLAPDFALCRHKQQLKLLNSLLSVGIIQAGWLQRTDVGEEEEEEEDRRK